MASSDALLVPVKAAALRIPVGPFFTNGGVRVDTTWSSPAAVVSKDNGAYASTSNAPVYVGRGRGYLDLTSSEINADSVDVVVDISNTDAQPFDWSSATSRAGAYLPVNVLEINTVTQPTPGAAGGLFISGTNSGLTVTGNVNFSSDFNMGGSLTANAFIVGTLSVATNVDIGGTLNVTGATTFAAVTTGTLTTTLAANTITATSIASNAFTSAKFASGAFDAVWAVAARTLTAGTNIVLPSNGLSNVTAWTVAITGNITGNLSGSVGSVTSGVTVTTNSDKTGYSLAAGSIATATFAAGATIPRVTLADTVSTVTGLTASNLDTTVSSRASATNLATANVSLVKIQAAVYDTMSASGSVLTLSNGATQTVISTGRTTA